MPADVIILKPQPHNPFETARSALVDALQEIKVPRAISAAMPWPDDFETIASHIREVALLCDQWLVAVGHEVRQNASACKIPARSFEQAFTGGTDDARYECQREADALREEYEAQGLAS